MKALFLDRDGVINHDYGHVYRVTDFHFIDGIFDLCRFFIELDYYIVIITNQAGIAKKIYSLEDFFKLDEWMKNRFLEEGIEILETFYCPHHPLDKCECRKPRPGLIINSINKYSLNPTDCILIGDNLSDLEAGRSAGITDLYLFSDISHHKLLDRLKKIYS